MRLNLTGPLIQGSVSAAAPGSARDNTPHPPTPHPKILTLAIQLGVFFPRRLVFSDTAKGRSYAVALILAFWECFNLPPKYQFCSFSPEIGFSSAGPFGYLCHL